MSLRITQLALQNQILRFTNQHNQSLFDAQRQLTSGIKFTRSSEAPLEFREVSTLNNQFQQIGVELEVISATESVLNTSVDQLITANDLITAARSAVQQGIQSTDQANNDALALEVEGILDQIKNIANTSFNDEYLYGGTRSSRPPFIFSEPLADGRSATVNYEGSQIEGQVILGESLVINNYLNGLSLFGRGTRETSVITSSTGAGIGTGTDTLISRANLEVTHNTTSFSGASGVLAGDSTSLDTIIGDYSLTIRDTSGTGASGFVSVNDGPEIPFDNTQTDLQIQTFEGSVISLNTTSIAAGYNGTITASATGFLSVDGGLTTTPIDFSSSQVVNDSLTEGFVSIDSSQIRRTGTEYLDFPGTSDIFQVLENVISDLRNERNLPNGPASELLQDRLGELDEFGAKFLGAVGRQSSSLKTLDALTIRNESISLQIQTDASEIQATDFSEAALQLTNSQQLLEYTFAVTAQINSINILDFLR